MSSAIKQIILQRFIDTIEGIIIFGSSADQKPDHVPNDIDILVITSNDLCSPKSRHSFAREIKQVLRSRNEEIEIYVHSLRDFSRLNLLHFGIGFGYEILYDKNGEINTILRNLERLMKEWGTRKIWAEDGSWVILPKGKILGEKETIPLGIDLMG